MANNENVTKEIMDEITAHPNASPCGSAAWSSHDETPSENMAAQTEPTRASTWNAGKVSIDPTRAVANGP
jgi:hypothetical protein